MANISKRAWMWSAAGVSVTAVAATVGFTSATHEPDPSEMPLTNASASYRRPGQTAQDWVTYADHVVLFRAVDEVVHDPEPIEVERGEGMVGRTVTLETQRVLWSSEDAPQPPPEVYEYPAFGFVFSDGVENMNPVGTQDEPRIQVGHDYVIAIDWEEARCTEGDVPQPAMWMGLDNSSVVPADAGVVGNGESGGQVSSAQARRNSPEPLLRGEGTFEGQMMGYTVGSLARELARTKPHPNPRNYDATPQAPALAQEQVPESEMDEALPEGVTAQDLLEATPEDTTCP
ncbi:hypothetical protein KIK06_29055 [Nocardiopsis sp. EMB25]|uniref:hypothetical protein n=1 Tax=Nocardiopsis sp. EMB25 TaxID=2835867 RepID=UPI0022835737|nr:hypothetical protein [Nocardiopsis sp. EMB25]MCY9787933.1 hypothetical protein [Nocardiopsis sp. EMB25]